MSAAVSVRATLAIRTRGVMTSAALCPENERVRPSRVAWSRSSRPSSALRRTSEPSSSAVRAPDSSSFGSIPIERITALAVLLKSRMTGLNTVVKSVWNGTTSLAVASGSASAKFFGTSSPMTIENSVASTMPTTAPAPGTTASGTPRPSIGSRSSELTAGSNV